MSNTYIGIRTSNAKASEYIVNRINFVGNNFRGELQSLEPNHGYYPMGQLPDSFRIKLEDQKPFYIVYSYGTPIAWAYMNDRGVIAWEIPALRYSVTTSKHQNLVRRAVW
jgi:hypothetical protein